MAICNKPNYWKFRFTFQSFLRIPGGFGTRKLMLHHPYLLKIAVKVLVKNPLKHIEKM